MLRLARSPRWLGGLLFAMLAAAVCAVLGRWQWDRSQSVGGDLQNLAYAFNWWLFAALSLWFWGKALRDESRRHSADSQPPVPMQPAAATAQRSAPTLPVGADAEVDEWNAWLAELGSRARR